MKRVAALSPLLIVLAACGGGETASAPVTNIGDADLELPIDEPVYDGDNLTIVDAAANDAAAQRLVPDTDPSAPVTNEAVTNGAAEAE